MTTREIAAKLGVTPRRVLARAKSRGAKGRMIGRAVLWPPKAVAIIVR